MNLSPIKRFRNLLKVYKIEVRQIYTYALFIGLINLTLPLGIQAIINFLQTGEYSSTWLLLVGFVLFGILVSGILHVMQLRVVENSQQDLLARSAFEFAYRIPRISFLKLDKIYAPELVNRFFDTLTIQKGVPKILIDFSLAIFQIFFGLILLTIYSPYFIILGIILASVIWLIVRISGPKGMSTSLKESKYKYQLAHWLEEIARLNRTFKIHNETKFHLHKTDNIVGNYVKARENHFQVLLSQFKLFIGLKVIVAAGLLLLGGMLVYQERMNIGQFVAAEIVIIMIINSIEKVIFTIDVIYDVLTALEKIGYMTDLELDTDKGNATIRPDTGISIKAKELVFGFPDEKEVIIDKLNFEIAHNEKVVLSGKSGTGKSILLQLVAGIHQIQKGQLFINDIPIAHYKRQDLYKILGVNFPINQIFDGTIKENILLGRNCEEKELSNVLRIVNLNDYHIRQPKGIDSKVESGGRRLPRSIIQKILIARLLIGNPKLLLMEDPLQFIEDAEKIRIIDYIMSKDREWTVIVISDFNYWKKQCDKILDLSKN
nr:ABC transporter ATP-binding protein [Membranihabitans maritimus]